MGVVVGIYRVLRFEELGRKFLQAGFRFVRKGIRAERSGEILESSE